MGRLAQTDGLTEIQREILATVRDFVDKEIIPVATELEHKDEYPTEIVEGMKELGLFGLTIPEEFGGLGESLLTYALVVEEIARGWMSVSGIVNTHFIVAYMINAHGTQEQKEYFLPRMAAGEIRGAFSMSEPGLGSDVAAISTKGVKDGRRIRPQRAEDVADQRRHLHPGRGAGCKTDEGGDTPYQNMTTFLIEKTAGFGEPTVPGLTVPGKIEKMGYKGVDTTELVLQDVRIPANRVLGGVPGKGFYQMMDGVEVGRVNVAARGCGVARRAFELGISYAQQRATFGKKIAEHQAIQFKLAEMATKVEAAHQMMVMAARKKDSGERNDLEAGMAKYLASEYCKEVVEDSFRIHGGYGFSKEYEIERLYREAPMLLIGEGTAEIQKMIIGPPPARGVQARRVAGPADVAGHRARARRRAPCGCFRTPPGVTRGAERSLTDLGRPLGDGTSGRYGRIHSARTAARLRTVERAGGLPTHHLLPIASTGTAAVPLSPDPRGGPRAAAELCQSPGPATKVFDAHQPVPSHLRHGSRCPRRRDGRPATPRDHRARSHPLVRPDPGHRRPHHRSHQAERQMGGGRGSRLCAERGHAVVLPRPRA